MATSDTNDADDKGVAPSPSQPSRPVKELIAPAHFFSQEVAARVYQDKVRKLRAGRPSGISNAFGSATVFLCPPADETAGRSLALEKYKPVDEMDALVRMQCFYAELESLCRKFLEDHLSAWKSGVYDLGRKPGTRHAVTDKAKCVVLKTSIIAFMVMITADQQEEEPPEWFQGFIWESMEKTGELSPVPDVQELLGVLWEGAGADLTNMCKNVSTSVCKELGFGAMGEPAWLAVFDFFSTTRRTSMLEKSLAYTSKTEL